MESRNLPFVWELEKGGKKSWLIGSGHLSKYRYTDSLRLYIEASEIIAFEGSGGPPMATQDVLLGPKLGELLGREDEDKVKESLGGDVYSRCRDLVPHAAYFELVPSLLPFESDGLYTVEDDALDISQSEGKTVCYLEDEKDVSSLFFTIPAGYFMDKFKEAEKWRDYYRRLFDFADNGDFDAFMETIKEDSIMYENMVKSRDPKIYEGAKPLLEKFKCLILLGAGHCEGFFERAEKDGYVISRVDV